MKRLIMVLMLVTVLAVMLVPLCFAEEEEGGTEISYSEKEQIVREVLDAILEKGDETFAGQEWWEVVASWVRSNLGALVAGIGGALALFGSLLVIFRSNPKLRAYVNSLGTSCKNWFESIGSKIESLSTVFDTVSQSSKKMVRTVEKQQKTIALLIDALEDVIKLSGASEGKKDIYITKIEEAKKSIAEDGGGDEI